MKKNNMYQALRYRRKFLKEYQRWQAPSREPPLPKKLCFLGSRIRETYTFPVEQTVNDRFWGYRISPCIRFVNTEKVFIYQLI